MIVFDSCLDPSEDSEKWFDNFKSNPNGYNLFKKIKLHRCQNRVAGFALGTQQIKKLINEHVNESLRIWCSNCNNQQCHKMTE